MTLQQFLNVVDKDEQKVNVVVKNQGRDEDIVFGFIDDVQERLSQYLNYKVGLVSPFPINETTEILITVHKEELNNG